jgi:hypothetical protein
MKTAHVLIGCYYHHCLSFLFLLDIFFIYISNAILKVTYNLSLSCTPTHPLLLPGPGIPLYWGIWFSQDRRPLIPLITAYATRDTSSRRYWLVHNVDPPIGLQTPLAPWVLSPASESCLARFPTPLRTICPGNNVAYSELGVSLSIGNQNNLPKTSLQAILI